MVVPYHQKYLLLPREYLSVLEVNHLHPVYFKLPIPFQLQPMVKSGKQPMFGDICPLFQITQLIISSKIMVLKKSPRVWLSLAQIDPLSVAENRLREYSEYSGLSYR